jgi:alkylhydroperoxidase family enzyme
MAGTGDGAKTAKWLEDAFEGQPTSEAAEMLIAIARGSSMGPGEGWFHPGQSRYGWQWLAARHGIKPDGAIPRSKFLGPEALFLHLDRNRDGELRADDFDWSDRSLYAQQLRMASYWFYRVNRAGDGRLTRDEWLRFFDEAARGKDHLTQDDLRAGLFGGMRPTSGAAGEGPSPQVLVRGLFRGEIGSMQEGPRLNDAAPDFTLRTRDGKGTIRLGDLIGKKPLVLVFGNFTCGPFRSIYPQVDDLAQQYRDEATFLSVYVREAHPTDGWRMSSNDEVGVSFAQPRTYPERVAAANRCSTQLKMSMPVVVDELDDRVGHTYSGMPARLYIIDRAGNVAYKSGRGPFGFKPGEMEQTLAMLLLDQPPERTTAPAKLTPAGRQSRLPTLTDEEAWRHLPAAEAGAGRPLPAWARALAAAMPRTTAAMLELDYLQREKSPLGSRLRGLMRWAVAHANRCAYSEAYALADLRRAGVGDAILRSLTGEQAGLSAEEAKALAFARKLTLEADALTDAEMAQLMKTRGERQVVAMVLLVAYANFQDRLVLALGLPLEEGGPLPPLDVRFARAATAGEPKAPPRPAPQETALPEGARRGNDVAWSPADFERLQQAMNGQRARQPRIAVPSWEEVRKQLPMQPPRPVRIRWSLVCIGYQPDLALGWSACTRAFGEEVKQDRVFEESLFWIVTRTLNCFY